MLVEREEPGGDDPGEIQRRVVWATETVGYDTASKQIMNAPSDQAIARRAEPPSCQQS